MKDIEEKLTKCSFFDNIPKKSYQEVLLFLKARKENYDKDTAILNIGEERHPSGFILKGCLEISLLDENGSQINVKHINEGNVFGMAMACSKKKLSPVRLRAITNCEILFLDFTNILNPSSINCKYKDILVANLLRDLANQTIFLNQRIRIIGQKKLRDKIKIFLQTQKIDEKGIIHMKFNRNELSDYLYADRSAVSRELSRMKDEGILIIDGQNIKIIDKSFLK